MNEFRRYQPGDVIERADLIRLRPGTIVKAEHDDRPTYVGKDGDFERYAAIPDEAVKLPELPDVDYLVLYVPPVPLPKVGETVSMDQLDALPHESVVLDSHHRAFQKIDELWFVTGKDSWWNSADLAPEVNIGLTLLWLPAEPHKS